MVPASIQSVKTTFKIKNNKILVNMMATNFIQGASWERDVFEMDVRAERPFPVTHPILNICLCCIELYSFK